MRLIQFLFFAIFAVVWGAIVLTASILGIGAFGNKPIELEDGYYGEDYDD